MAVAQLLIGEQHPTILCEAIIILGGGAPFCLLKVFMLVAQAQGDVPSLNKIGEMPSIPFSNRELSGEHPGHWHQVPVATLREGFWFTS